MKTIQNYNRIHAASSGPRHALIHDPDSPSEQSHAKVIARWLIPLVSLCCMAQPLEADLFEDFQYTDNGTEITIDYYWGSGDEFGAVVIPDTILGKPVTRIGNHCFSCRYDLVSVQIPESVTSIGDFAFEQCGNLMDITLPGSVTRIGEGAFSSCGGLTSVTIPGSVSHIADRTFVSCYQLINVTISSGVTRIGSGAFTYCTGLSDVVIPATVNDIAVGAFDYCTALISLTVDEANPNYSSEGGILFNKTQTVIMLCPEGINGGYTIPAGVTGIGEFAFFNCDALTNVVLPSGLTDIGERAFSTSDGLTNMILPASVESVGTSAFANCAALVSIEVETGNPNFSSTGGVLFNQTKSILIQYPAGILGDYVIPGSVTHIGDGAFAGCGRPWGSDLPVGLTGITIPDSVTSIGKAAFSGCNRLTSITLPAGVTRIEDFTFLNCYGLTAVTIPAGVTRIGAGAFGGCGDAWDPEQPGGLTSITIPDSVTSIGDGAFSGCNRLTSVTIPPGVTRIEDRTFSFCLALESVIIPDGVNHIGDGAFYCGDGWGDQVGLISVSIPGTVTGFGNHAFSGCNRLTGLVIPTSVTSIGSLAFQGCRSLMSVEIPDGVTSISEGLFCDCSGLTSVTLPTSLSTIADRSFSGCYQLTNMTIPSGVTSIGCSAFHGCGGLTSLVIPESVTLIGQGAFAYCIGMTSVTLPSGVTSIQDDTFAECSGLTSVTIPESVTKIGMAAFYRCTGLVNLTISGGVTIIGNAAFSGCISLTSVEIPDSVINIGLAAFQGCLSLTNVVLSGNITTLPEGVFCNCSALEDVVIPMGVTSVEDAAFLGCSSLKSVMIPESVINVGHSAFVGCSSLTSVVIPASTTHIDSSAFYGCSSMTCFSVAASNPNYSSSDGVLFNKSKTQLIQFPAAIGGVYMIHEGVTSIGPNAFSQCSSLSEVILPNSVINIGFQAFWDCSGLTSIIFPSGLEEIGDSAFIGCSGLSHINIPSGVTRIGQQAFAYCTSLEGTTFIGNAPSMGEHVFDSVADGFTVYYSIGMTGFSSPTWMGYPAILIAPVIILEPPSEVSILAGGGFGFCTVAVGDSISSVFTIRNTGMLDLTDLVATVDGPDSGDFIVGPLGSLMLVPGGETSFSITFTPSAAGVRTATLQIASNDPVNNPLNIILMGNFLAGAIDQPGIDVIDGGDAPWLAQPAETHDGLDAARSGSITHGQESSMETTLNGPGTLYFWWKVSSEADGDFLGFHLDGVLQSGRISGEVGWQFCSHSIPAGPHAAKWSYTKNAANSSGQDAGWIDQVEFLQSPVVATAQASAICEDGATLNGMVNPNGSPTTAIFEYGTTTAYGAAVNVELSPDNGTWPQMVSSAVSGLQAGTIYHYRITATNGGGVGIGEDMTFEPVPYDYEIMAGEITITRYTGTGGAVGIPGTINGIPVARIGMDAFYDCDELVSVTIPPGIREIGSYAFCDCQNLAAVDIAGGLMSIEQGAFQGCIALTSINLPVGLYRIGDTAFNYCTALTSMVIPASVEYIERSAFGSCSALTSISVDVDNPYYSSAGGVLFNKAGTLLIQCPAGATGEYVIPDGVYEVGYRAFFACGGLTKITMEDGVNRIGEGAFSYCSGLLRMDLASSVTRIGEGAFQACSQLTSVSIPSGVSHLEDWTFSSCRSLTDITLPTHLVKIGVGAFYYCSGLTGITIPASVNLIGMDAFSACGRLTFICVDPSNVNFSDVNGVLYNKPKTKLVQCPAGMSGTYAILSGVTDIGGSAFYECDKLTTITVPPSVTVMGDAAFYGCRRLTGITIPYGVSRIGMQTFLDCGLTSVSIPTSVTSIGLLAFASCDMLTNVMIPPGVTSIEGEAFSGCRGLTTVTISGGVTSIGNYAFHDCGNLTSAVFTGNAPVMGSQVFESAAVDFKVYFFNGRNGFTTPTWMGYPALAMDPAPGVVTGVASGITAETALLHGTVNPNGAATIAQFEYGLTSAYGRIAGATLWPNNGTNSVSVTASVNGLQPGQLYHYRLTATNPSGSSFGEDMTFTTHPALTVIAMHGVVLPASGQYSPGTVVELAATSSPGYIFGGWSGDAIGSDNPLSVLMDANKTITANFVPDLSDNDGDGLSNHDEIVTYRTDPALPDTDGDNLTDAFEVGRGHYWIIAGTFTWAQAREDAHARHGELACFPTHARWNRAMESLGANAFDNFTGLWIGASDSAEEGNWAWVNGEPFTFSQWATSRPSVSAGNTLDYAEVSGGGGAELEKWYDRTTTTIRDGYILETGFITNPNNPDEDTDGLNDGAEKAEGSNPFLADTDGDGFNDGFEVSAGFNPTLAGSTPEGFTSLRIVPGLIPAAVEFRFNAANGVSYWIEDSCDLNEWKTLENEIIGQGSVVTRTYSTQNLTQRFFRVGRN
jgi:uncharacterized repeat protein (TIGR02543 family)